MGRHPRFVGRVWETPLDAGVCLLKAGPARRGDGGLPRGTERVRLRHESPFRDCPPCPPRLSTGVRTGFSQCRPRRLASPESHAGGPLATLPAPRERSADTFETCLQSPRPWSRPPSGVTGRQTPPCMPGTPASGLATGATRAGAAALPLPIPPNLPSLFCLLGLLGVRAQDISNSRAWSGVAGQRGYSPTGSLISANNDSNASGTNTRHSLA